MTVTSGIVCLTFFTTLQIVSADSACSAAVQIQPAWPPVTLVPSETSSVVIDCLPNPIVWTIGLNGRAAESFSDDLNMFGIYLTHDSQFLIINNTAVNNNTIIRCGATSLSVTRETRLIVYKPSLTVTDISVQRVNASWSPLPSAFNTTEKFTLTIISCNNHEIQELLLRNRTYYEFSSNEDKSSCTNFTFSLSSNLSSPIHNGNCVSQSNTVQRPLPSLPNITSLESSLSYSLSKQPGQGGVVLNVSFLPASVCNDNYVVTGYLLEVIGQNRVIETNSTNQSLITLTANELNENANYSFQIIISNMIGNIPSRNRNFLTTDVQMVTATALKEEDNVFIVQCDFITGSNAQGCMVVLVGEFGNITANLTRINPCTILTVNETLLSLNDTQVFGFDIESDGSVGSLAIRGEIERNMNVTCPRNIDEVTDDSSRDIWIAVTILGLITIIIIIVIIASLYHCKVRRSSLKHSNTTNGNQEQENIQLQDIMSGPVYADLVKTRTPGDGDDAADHHYNTTSHVGYEEKEDVNSSNNNNYSELNEDSATEHHYFVLENNGGRPQKKSEDITPDPDAPALPPPFKPEPPPVYQDINGLPYMQEDTAENEYATVKK